MRNIFKKGVSLISLVVIIIVLIILTSISILMVVNTNAINKANQATLETNLQTAKEELASKYYSWVNNHITSDFTTSNIPELNMDLEKYKLENDYRIVVIYGEPKIVEIE